MPPPPLLLPPGAVEEAVEVEVRFAAALVRGLRGLRRAVMAWTLWGECEYLF
jgi:hypothetical protein